MKPCSLMLSLSEFLLLGGVVLMCLYSVVLSLLVGVACSWDWMSSLIRFETLFIIITIIIYTGLGAPIA